MSRFTLVVLTFALLFAIIASALAPRFLGWYASPPVPIGVSCDPAISWAMEKLMLSQGIGVIIGAILGGLFFFWVRGKSQPKPPTT